MKGRMSNARILTIVGAVIAVGAIIGIFRSCDSFSPSQAPDFTLPTLTGANITLSELEGTAVVLNFWSISCYWCRKQLPYLESVAQKNRKEVKVIAINIADNATNIQRFFKDYEPAMIVALDGGAKVFVDYCLAYNNPGGLLPFTLFVDREGIVRHLQIGAFASEAALWNKLHEVLGITVP